MSADNWAVCPRCKQEVLQKREERMLAAEKAYGTASPEEYLAMLNAIDPNPTFQQNFREDYIQGMGSDGVYSVQYHGKCSDCGLTHVFKHEEKLTL